MNAVSSKFVTKTLGPAAFYLVIASQTLCVKLAGGSRMAIQRQDLNRVALFLKVKQGQVLSGHVISTHQVRSEMECLHSCLSRDKCMSFNYGLYTSKSRHICELNSGSRESPGHVFETSDGFSYYEPSTMTLPQQDFVFHNQSQQHDAESTVDAAVESTATSPVISSVFSKRSSSSLMTSALLSSVLTSAMPYATSPQPLTCPLVSSSFIASSSSSFMTSIQPSTSWDNSASSSGVQQVEPASCKYLYEQRKSFQNQVYTLMFGSQRIPVYCHMGNLSGCGDGGWTLVMKIDGTKTTFHYDSTFWTNRTAFNLAGGKTGFDHQETKLPSYWKTPFSKICLGMKIGHQTKIAFIVIEKHADSLYSLIADGKYRNTSLGRDLWKKLLGSYASLQQDCNKEGFNSQALASSKSKARIGIIGNDQKDCYTCDSRIGFGTGGEPDDNNSCGNVATSGGDNKSRRIKTMGYILVQ